MTTLETLKAARAKIADPEHWTQRYSAVDARGYVCSIISPEACRWCATGAIRFMGADTARAISALIGYSAGAALSVEYKVIEFNDTHTHSEVLGLFDRAIASLEVSA